MKIEELRKEPGVQGLVQLAHNAIDRIRELESELANHKKTCGSLVPLTTDQGARLYNAVERLAALAGEDTDETVEWLCGSYGGMAKLFEAYFGPKNNQTTEFCPMCEGKPAPREPLSDDQIDAINRVCPPTQQGFTYRKFARAIEAAHGIKE